MITKQQAIAADEFHYGVCTRTTGPRGGVKTRIVTYRRNGATKTWVTRPEDWRVPVKWGWGETIRIRESDAALFHIPDECPLVAQEVTSG